MTAQPQPQPPKKITGPSPSPSTPDELSPDELSSALTPGGDDAALANLGKIREILFGVQNRTTDQRLAALEERLRRDAEHMQRRLDDLEKLIQTSIESIGERLKSLRVEAAAGQGNVAAEARQSSNNLKQSLHSLDERVERERKEIRQALAEHVEALRENIRQQHDDALKTVQLQGERLQASKVDRLALGELLADLSARVSR